MKVIKKMYNKIFLFLAVTLYSQAVYASSDNTFRVWIDWIINVTKGSFGLLIAILALAMAIVMMLFGKWVAVFTTFAIVIVATLGPDIVDSLFSATF